MGHHILTLNDFMVATRGVLNWALQSGLTPSFTTDFVPSTATSTAFTTSLAGNSNEYSTNSTISVSAINCPIDIKVGSISTPSALLFGRVSTSTFSSTNLQSGVTSNGWIQLGVGDVISADLNATVGFGVYKIGGDPTVTVQFVNASTPTNTVLGTHTFT